MGCSPNRYRSVTTWWPQPEPLSVLAATRTVFLSPVDGWRIPGDTHLRAIATVRYRSWQSPHRVSDWIPAPCWQNYTFFVPSLRHPRRNIRTLPDTSVRPILVPKRVLYVRTLFQFKTIVTNERRKRYICIYIYIHIYIYVNVRQILTW